MKLSMRWLSDFVKVDATPRQYAADLTMSGSKVEGWENEGHGIDNVVVGKVLSVEKHPNADSLFVCSVDAGAKEPVQVVTGAANVSAGDFVPVAMDGSTVAGGKKISSGKLRGIDSNGMLCSLGELGLTKHDFPYADEDGIFILGSDCDKTPGLDIRKAVGLDDVVVEFEITSNRPDCLSVSGLARETAATYGIDFKMPEPRVKAGAGSSEDFLTVTVENPELCMRYAAGVVKNVKIEPSPRWLRERLRASGVRPINNIVDITNYVMLEYGQPMHAFDLRHVSGNKIIVRNAADGEKITTLDGVERVLSPEMLVIADEKAPSAVAGVMGGEFSGVYDDTEVVVFESACFNGASVRMTSKKLGLRTESSSRFEKGLDAENCLPALKRACELVELLGAGQVCDGFIDAYGEKKAQKILTLEPEWINSFLGVDVPEKDMVKSLISLGFGVNGREITVPSFRGDVESAADISEEIARLYGYDKIPSTALRGLAQAEVSPEGKLVRLAEQTLIASGYSEVVTYSFISPSSCNKIRLPEESPLRNVVTISNPLGEDTSVMRTTAIPSMLETLARNYNNRNAAVRFYELATEYMPVPGEALPDEKKCFILGAYGGCDFFDVKSAAELVLERAGISGWDIRAVTDNPTFHPGRFGEITCGGDVLGSIGEVHPAVLENYEINARAYIAVLDFRTMFKHSNTEKTYKPLPRFPASTRDLALVCGEDMPIKKIQTLIGEAVREILEKIEMFDVYRGKQVGEGKKSVAFSLTLRAPDRTLTDEECDEAVGRALSRLKTEGVELRG